MEPNPEVTRSEMEILDTLVKSITLESKSKKLPVRTGQILYPPAWECVPVARGSSPCVLGGGQWTGSAKVSLMQKISKDRTHGSGECIGAEEWRMYCVH